MLDLIVDEREFTIEKPRTIPGPIPLRYVSQKPRRQLITLILEHPRGTQYIDFLIPLPWIIYEWAHAPHINTERPWLINAMYFSPTPISESLNVSKPCLPNFYNTLPCCDFTAEVCQEEFDDLSFIQGFWSEAFNEDGDLLNPHFDPHPVWACLAEKAGCPDYNSASNVRDVFLYWERLSIDDLTSLNWPQNLRIPECSNRL